MKILSAATLTALAQPTVRQAQLVHMALDVPLRANSSSWKLTWGGHDYMASHGLGRIDPVDTTPGEIKGLKFELAGISTALLAQALLENPQGKAVTLWTAFFDADSQVIEASVDWAGRLDVFSHRIVPGSGPGQPPTATLQCTAEHIGVDLLRPGTLMFSDQDQQRLHPGDRGCIFIVDQVDKEIAWPGRTWFLKHGGG